MQEMKIYSERKLPGEMAMGCQKKGESQRRGLTNPEYKPRERENGTGRRTMVPT